jgi:hypothetical protein
MAGFSEQNFNFLLLFCFDLSNIFQKFKKNLVQKSLNQQKDVNFQEPSGREAVNP